MPDPQSTIPAPPTSDPELAGAGSGSRGDQIRGLISRLSGGGIGAVEQKLQQHYAQRRAEADMAKAEVNQLRKEYVRANQQKALAKTEEEGAAADRALADLQTKWEIAKQRYIKIAGQSKEARPILQQTFGLIEHIIGHKPPGEGQPQGQDQGPQGATPAGRQSTIPAPPQQQQGAQPAAAGAPQPSSTIPKPPSAEMIGDPAEREALYQAQRKSDAALDLYKREGEADAELKSPKRMVKDLTEAGFTPEQARQIVQSKLGGAGMRTRYHPLKVMDPNDPTKQIPAMQSTIPEEDGSFPIVSAETGEVIANPRTLVPAMLPTQRTGEMPVYNPQTNQFEQQPTYSSSQKVAPKAAGAGSGGGRMATVPPPPKNGATASSSSTPAAAAGSKGGRHGVPARQFGILYKQATAIDEARNSLIGDDPDEIAGLAGDLAVFDNPESVKKIGQYLELVNSQMANEAKAVAGQGAWAAAEWYMGLPQAVIGLQQGALRESSQSLTPEEQKFVADYYRVMGTIGGMRASTGASAAQWSYNTLRSELPTPGPVTSRAEAKRRIKNYVQETNVVAKRNPLSQATDVDKLDRSQSSGKAVSLAAARKLPANRGKSDDEIRKDIKKHGHKVVD